MRDTEQVFEEVFNGHGNFATPILMRYEQADNFHIELTKGQGIFTQSTYYGLTVIEEFENGDLTLRKDLSGAFFEKPVMKKYIKLLSEGEISKAIKLHGRHIEKS